MTRIVFLGFPFIMTWILFELKNFEKGSVLWLIILSLPLFMFHAQIPDPAWQRSLWESWYPEFNAPILTLTVLAYVMIISIGIFKKTMVHK